MARERDNSWGRGYYPLPARLSGLGRFVENLSPKRLLAHHVFPDDGVHMLTAKSDTHLSIMRRDLQSLLDQGLVRIQVNDRGTIDFYFEDESL
jgi:hypothetical protein